MEFASAKPAPTPVAEGAPATVPLPTLRVVFVVPGAPVGNSMIFARRQAEGLAREGVAVETFYLRTRTSPWGLWKGLVAFRRLIRRIQPSVIHAHFGTVTALFAALAAPFLPLVITFRGGDLNPVPAAAPRADRFRSWVGVLLSQAAALRATRIVCVSRQLRERLLWRHGRACILPSGVDRNIFFPQPQALARKTLGWGLDPHVVLFNAGGRDWIKRPALARQAVACARRQIPDLRLEVIDGSLDPAQVPVLMNAVDCLLLTSATEGSPTVVQEALACGLPVVAVRVGDTEERLAGSRYSCLAEDDPEALGAALCLVLSNRHQRHVPPESLSLDPDTDPDSDVISASWIAVQLRKLYEAAAGS